jgi:hypothetical protein
LIKVLFMLGFKASFLVAVLSVATAAGFSGCSGDDEVGGGTVLDGVKADDGGAEADGGEADGGEADAGTDADGGADADAGI